MAQSEQKKPVQERPNYIGPKPFNYNRFEELDFESDEDDCHPNIEIGTWRRLKERMRREKGIKKKEPHLVDKWNVTTTNERYHIDPTKSPKTTEEQKAEQEDATAQETTASLTENKDESSADAITESPSNETNAPSNDISQTKPEATKPTQAEAEAVPKPETKPKAKPAAAEPIDDEPYKARSNPQTFLDDNLDKLRKFAKTKNDGKADRFLKKYPHLVHEASEGFLITHAVDRAVEGASRPELARLSRRCLMIHNLVQSCSQQNVSPQIGVNRFYEKIAKNEKLIASYKVELNKQVAELMERIEQRRVERLAELQQIPDDFEEEDKAPIGPGGLDPTEVLNSLPQEMQDAFISQDVAQLKQVLVTLDKDEAEYHMRRCVDAGLWVQPEEERAADDGNNDAAAADDDDNAAADDNDGNEEEQVPKK